MPGRLRYLGIASILNIADKMYTPVCRGTITNRVDAYFSEMKGDIKTTINEQDRVSLTVDIWTDRNMRGFLGVTAHFLSTSPLKPQSLLLACTRFKGSHTGEHISEALETVCAEYSIKQKISYVISDNAANMLRAFTIFFPQEEDTDTMPTVDDADIWQVS